MLTKTISHSNMTRSFHPNDTKSYIFNDAAKKIAELADSFFQALGKFIKYDLVQSTPVVVGGATAGALFGAIAGPVGMGIGAAVGVIVTAAITAGLIALYKEPSKDSN